MFLLIIFVRMTLIIILILVDRNIIRPSALMKVSKRSNKFSALSTVVLDQTNTYRKNTQHDLKKHAPENAKIVF